jgi:uncharacterized repeat protein (TIGR01451 family)
MPEGKAPGHPPRQDQLREEKEEQTPQASKRQPRRFKVISAKRALVTLGLFVLTALALPSASVATSPGAAWAISTGAYGPTNFSPGGQAGYVVIATNVGSKATDGSPVTISDLLPAGLTPTPGIKVNNEKEESVPCSAGPPLTCTVSEVVPPGFALRAFIPVNVAPGAPTLLTNQVSVSGGGATGASDSVDATVSSESVPFGIQSFTAALLDGGGAAQTQAGAHPYSMRVAMRVNTIRVGSGIFGAEDPRDIVADLPPGLVLNPRATPVRCTEVQLETTTKFGADECPDAAAIGVVYISINAGPLQPGFTRAAPLYNLVPPGGRPAEFGFNATGLGFFIHLQGRVRSDGDYGLSSDTFDLPAFGATTGVTAVLWGDPSDPGHDRQRGDCVASSDLRGTPCPVSAAPAPLITMPSACQGPLQFGIKTDSWQNPGDFVSRSAQSEDAVGNPVGVTGCDKLPYDPATESIPSTDRAESGSGFDFNLDFPNNGLNDTGALAESNTEKAIVTLPQGVTVNPSVGEGLGFCRPNQYAKETTFSVEGEGCPGDSKVGTLSATTPLVDEAVEGSVYLAQQDDPSTTTPGAENPFDTDIALYLVLRNTKLGVMVKRPLKVVPDPGTGQLVASIDGIPQLPIEHFNFHFKEGARPALITPGACGKYTTVARLYPASDPTHPKIVNSDFEITNGVHGGPCPSGGVAPFHPEFQAGSLNNAAKAYSPFNMRLLRSDGEQDMTKFSAVLPPGVLGKLAGISKCPDSAINSARSKTGRQELASPSCPASSLIGHTLAGAGVGDSLTYVKGQLYLGGPYHGDPLSVIAITPALAGPFDAGTVVVREALTLNPETAEVEVDGQSSDPIPHILKGIVLKVRDLRVYVDRPDFILNPTSCEESSAKSSLFGSYLNAFDPSDDIPVDLKTRYQAADCASLGFKPKLAIKLRGGTKRGGHPALKAVVNARSADANIGGAVVTLPRSAFLDQAHIRTICTRVQYSANGGSGAGCPKAAQYGYARAFTPLLDEPVEGPVYLRSSNHRLPDLVAALHGIVDVDIVGRIDSFKGGIRSSFETVPDAPVSKFILTMQGGKKGLVINSKNLCAGTNRADAVFIGQNGKLDEFVPVVRPAGCGKARSHRRHPPSRRG